VPKRVVAYLGSVGLFFTGVDEQFK